MFSIAIIAFQLTWDVIFFVGLCLQTCRNMSELHDACMRGNIEEVTSLLGSSTECHINVQDTGGESPLHIACKSGHMKIVKVLLKDKRCDLNLQNSYGNTILHVACKRKLLDIVRILLEMRCSTNIHNTKGETAQDIPFNEDGDCLLHIACAWGDADIVEYLITDGRFNPDVESSNLENTPLDIACNYGQDDTIVQLCSYKECNPNVQNKKGDTPLHNAVRHGQVDTICKLLSCKECDPNTQNKEGDTPLHIAVRDMTSVILHLLTDKRCNPNAQNKEGDTPLHIAISLEQKDTILQLLSCKDCDVNVQNEKGDTPLHIAVIQNRMHGVSYIITPVIFQLLSNEKCNPNVVNKDHLTPLLTAIKHNNSAVASALLQHKDCDPAIRDLHGNTPLHLACIAGETHPEMVPVAKKLLTSVDPSCVNNAGQTPIELTTKYQLIQAISHIIKCMTKQSVQTYINMFIIGNPETGKSTLVKAICKEATNFLWTIVPKQVRRVKNVLPHTAGIIPTTFRSKKFGNTIIYDLAGQVEYYTSHAAVIQSTVISTPPAFIVVVNLSESEDKISQTLGYWWSFIDNHAAHSSAPPQVVLVGSHADIVKSTGRSVQEKMTQISALLKQFPASFHFAGQVALDCRDPASRKLQHFCSLVNQSCSVLRQTADVDLRCHVLYAFLLEIYNGKIACTVSDVATSVKENSALLPHTSDSLIPLISTLSDKGLLLLVEGGENHGDSWIILQKQALLGEINGVIFAPNSFTQHKDLSWSTGVVPFSKLKKEFLSYNPSMVCDFLTYLEFCFKIKDHETLSLLRDEASNMEDISPDVSEVYYFFPALVSVENPLHVFEKIDVTCYKCGWLYQCIRPDQFLTTQFLHVLILRLAFRFAIQLAPGDSRQDSLPLRRRCSVWKHGIAWLNRAPIETVVEVGLQHQSVLVMMCCPKEKYAECVQLRSEVIQKILKAKDEFCQAVKMSESFLHPDNVKYPFTDNTEYVKCYSLTEIARVIVDRAENALDQRGRNPIPVQDLLLFDPLNIVNNTELVHELFSEKRLMDKTLRSQVLETLSSECDKLSSHYAFHVYCMR